MFMFSIYMLKPRLMNDIKILLDHYLLTSACRFYDTYFELLLLYINISKSLKTCLYF